MISNELVHAILSARLEDTPGIAQGQCLGLVPRRHAPRPASMPQLTQRGALHQVKATRASVLSQIMQDRHLRPNGYGSWSSSHRPRPRGCRRGHCRCHRCRCRRCRRLVLVVLVVLAVHCPPRPCPRRRPGRHSRRVVVIAAAAAAAAATLPPPPTPPQTPSRCPSRSQRSLSS